METPGFLHREIQLEPPQSGPNAREHHIIETLLRAAPPAPADLRVPPGDDAVVLADGTAVTVDALVEGVHWDARLSGSDVGFKAVAVSASDLGAMGARPHWMVLAVCLPAPHDQAWLAELAEGVGEACRAFEVALVGGDVTRTPGPRFVSVTMGGPCPRPVRRSGARPGDVLWVTGTLGLAGAGYLLPDPPAAALRALRRPRPPVAFARDLAAAGLATAMMDLSDGLASDLPRLCAASGVGAEVDPDALPRHPDLVLEDPVPLQVGAGDDYELLFTAAPGSADAIVRIGRRHDVAVTAIGSVDGGGARLRGRAWPSDAFSHWGAA